jgi:outer membrane protein OmpA-like peptidoglycan-associated protein
VTKALLRERLLRYTLSQEEVMLRKFSIVFIATLFAAACASNTNNGNPDDPNQKAKRGAGIGAAAGAVVGAVIGNQTGNPATGAVIGAAAGAAIGGGIGHKMDQQQKELQQIPNVEVTRPSENEINVQLTNDILFDFGSAALRSESQTTLRDLAANFQKYPDEAIDVEGHTDNVGSATYNQTLSENRANSVKSFLINSGVPSSRVTATGFGETRPKANNDTPEGRQVNRRVEIHIRATQS